MVREGGQWVRGAAPAEGTPAGELALVRMHLDQGKHSRTISAAKKFLKKYPLDYRGEEAMMLAAEAQMHRGRYMKAYELYEKQLEDYPIGEFFDRALYREFRIANAFLAGKKQVVWGFLRLSAEAEALEMLSRIVEHAPGSILAEDALLRIADHYYEDRYYAEAAEAYDNYLELFGKSERASYAMLRSATAIYSTYRGVDYNDTPLVEAELRLRTFKQNYPTSSRSYVDQILRQIAILRAQKDYNAAQLYERINRPDAAVFYYKEVVKRDNDSKWAEKALVALLRLEASASPG